MSDDGITVISKDLDAFHAKLESRWGVGASLLLGQFAQQHKRIAEAMHADSMDAFRNAANPETGEPWAALSWSTLRGRLGARRAATFKKLVGRGRLRASIRRESAGDQAAISSNLVYARIHQLGGLAGRTESRVKIPARPYMGVGRATISAIEHALGVLGGWT